ncbi:Uncharacterised protein [Slackia heliotrinireducens]|uniref:Uncharacterized protein n=1 Tax=Slackia heliotrinireducens (strain ATCC 29202 / DSM 20476 / NCTC 11029 / RHS 1) TaxID=471855 RepID=C7N182_SLAHD|nr:Cna B-type domain-containing protein [Slackia heliotrinireducens]ACV23304.1 hypothetical protein Shel_22940 [Slackia heliotrinireducens DSM 20476]VEH02492.1 Uncharacterised protein [Slackia heliotrinireducens]
MERKSSVAYGRIALILALISAVFAFVSFPQVALADEADDDKAGIDLTVTKEFTGTAADLITDDELATVTFELLKKDDEGAFTSVEKVPYSDFEDGSYTFSDVEAGSYRLAEGGAEGLAKLHGWEFEQTWTWDDGSSAADFDISDADVEEGVAPRATVVNRYDRQTTEVTATVRWQDAAGAAMVWPDGEEVTLDLYVLEPVGNVYAIADDAEPLASVTLDGQTDAAGEARSGAAVFKGVDRYDANGTVRYAVVQRDAVHGYEVRYGNDAAAEFAAVSEGSALVVDRAESTSFTLDVTWDNAPHGTTATVHLYAYAAGQGPAQAQLVDEADAIVLDGVPDDAGESKSWQAAWDCLPAYDADGTGLVYIAREVTCTSGWMPVYAESVDYASDQGVIDHVRDPYALMSDNPWIALLLAASVPVLTWLTVQMHRFRKRAAK